ncbi:hypothetical protein FB567DRAFT_83567 [Paraphoma chrysanthemicola]|uniref:Uncharacterized protein n=1 Tax=Paraphoma chrysanthemicola TaxID=798071 RepID=A0A8K0VXD4_9PLEO|nr:hypothetical protein FB567DRAFT_83567 [Paraphoma chrysanthemicola]
MTCGHTTLVDLLTDWQERSRKSGGGPLASTKADTVLWSTDVARSVSKSHALCVQGWPITPALNFPAQDLSLPDQPAPPRLSVRLLASACSSSQSGTSISRCGHLDPNRLLPCEDAHCADAFLACFPPPYHSGALCCSQHATEGGVNAPQTCEHWDCSRAIVDNWRNAHAGYCGSTACVRSSPRTPCLHVKGPRIRASSTRLSTDIFKA